MMRIGSLILALALAQTALLPATAQEASAPVAPPGAVSSASAPALVRFHGTIPGAQGMMPVNFALYKDQTGGAPLWRETQDVALDANSRYTIYLGANHAQGVPPELFASGQARWLGVQPAGQAEQTRVRLVSVPYALKAVDADTLGGLPAASYVSTANDSGQYRALVQTIVQQLKTSGLLAPLVATSGATNFTDTTTNQVVGVTQLGTGQAINATSSNAGSAGAAIFASNTNSSTSSYSYGVFAQDGSTYAIPIRGIATAATGPTRGVQGNSASTSGVGGYFAATATSGTNYGVEGVTDSPSGYGVYAVGPAYGMQAVANNTTGATAAFSGTVNSAAGIAAIFNNNAGGQLASFQNTGVQVIAFDGAGDVTAAGTVTGSSLASTVATGTAPLKVTSTTMVPNLNAGLLGGLAASAFQQAGTCATLGANTFTAPQTINVAAGKPPLSVTSATEVPSLNASLLGGLPASAFQNAGTGVRQVRAALLQWYPQTFTVGSAPAGVAFDGASIWVVNYSGDSVTKLLASTGAAQGTYGVGTLVQPYGIAFDGANIWIASEGTGTVVKLLASTGAVVGSYTVGTAPLGVAFDGANIWVTNRGSNTVTKLVAGTGAVVGTYSVGTSPWDVAFDGVNIWVTNKGSNTVTELLASSGATENTYTVGTAPEGLVFDGVNLWVANNGSNTVTELLASSGAVEGTYTVGTSPIGVAYDGVNVWVTNNGSSSVTKLLATTGAVAGTYTVGSRPSGLGYDGANVWVANGGGNSVVKIPSF
jgi:YVTN family beta-propeller protein